MSARKGSSADRLRRLMEKVQSIDLGGGGFWKPPVGRTTIRILPEAGGMDYFFVEVGSHYLGGKPHKCPKICTDGAEECPICDVNEALFQAGDKEAAKDFRASRSFWMNIVVRGKEENGPAIFTPGVLIFQNLVSLIADPDYGDITDIEEGFDIKIDREGEGRQTKYQVRAARNPSPLSDDEDDAEEWLEAAKDLQEFVSSQVLDYDALAKVAGVEVYLEEGVESITEDDDDEEEEISASDQIAARLARRQQRRKK